MKSPAFAVTAKIQPGPASRSIIIRYYDKSLINLVDNQLTFFICIQYKTARLAKRLVMWREKQLWEEIKLVLPGESDKETANVRLGFQKDCNCYGKGPSKNVNCMQEPMIGGEQRMRN